MLPGVPEAASIAGVMHLFAPAIKVVPHPMGTRACGWLSTNVEAGFVTALVV
jgi:hypothetical protein